MTVEQAKSRLSAVPRFLSASIAIHLLVSVIVIFEASYLHPEYRFLANGALGWSAIVIVALSIGLAASFLAGAFSFGYVLTYYFYVMIVGFLWINQFTTLNYDHHLAGVCAVASLVAFGAPALLIRKPLKSVSRLSLRSAEFLIISTAAFSVVVVLVSVRFSFHSLGLSYAELRDELLFTAKMRSAAEVPVLVRYCIGIVSSAVLPFLFACFVERRQYWLALAVLLVLACLFPVSLTKTSLVSPFWLVFVAVIASIFDARSASVLTLLAPMAIGLLALQLPWAFFEDIFHVLDFRMMVIPSASLSFYNDFFTHHPTTSFCQIGVVRNVFGCHYREQLGVVLSEAYGLGNYNASLFATEGVASVGTLLSPLSALACGLVVGGVNRLSAGLPSRFILVSSSIVTFSFLNVPFSTTLATHGAALLFLMWYLMPREFLNPRGVPSDPIG